MSVSLKGGGTVADAQLGSVVGPHKTTARLATVPGRCSQGQPGTVPRPPATAVARRRACTYRSRAGLCHVRPMADEDPGWFRAVFVLVWVAAIALFVWVVASTLGG